MPECTRTEGGREAVIRLLNGRGLWLTGNLIVLPFPTWTHLLPGPIFKNTEASHRDQEKKNCAPRDHRGSESRQYRTPQKDDYLPKRHCSSLWKKGGSHPSNFLSSVRRRRLIIRKFPRRWAWCGKSGKCGLWSGHFPHIPHFPHRPFVFLTPTELHRDEFADRYSSTIWQDQPLDDPEAPFPPAGPSDTVTRSWPACIPLSVRSLSSS